MLQYKFYYKTTTYLQFYVASSRWFNVNRKIGKEYVLRCCILLKKRSVFISTNDFIWIYTKPANITSLSRARDLEEGDEKKGRRRRRIRQDYTR